MDPDDLGFVLPHEHLFLDFQRAKQPLPNKDMKDVELLSLGNIGNVRQYP